MSKLLTVVGGTGTQGLSLINAALAEGTYKIRTLTCNIFSEKSLGIWQQKELKLSEQTLMMSNRSSRHLR
jgi:hypothetical protein